MESGVVCRSEIYGIVGGDGPVDFREVDANVSEPVVGQGAGAPIAIGRRWCGRREIVEER